MLLATALGRAGFVTLLVALLWSRSFSMWQLYLLAVAFGTADAFSAPAAQSYLPTLVESEQLPAANALSQVSAQGVSLVVPGPAGILVSAWGTAWAFAADAVSFLAIVAALAGLPDPPRAASEQEQSLLRSIRAGLEYVRGDRPLRTLMAVAAVVNFCVVGPLTVGLAWIARYRFATAASLGLLMSCEAAGGLLGMVLAGKWKARHRGRLLLEVCALTGLCVMAIGATHSLPALGALIVLMCAAMSFLNVQLVVWFQQRVERAVLGRVMSLLMLAAIGLQPFSMAAAGTAIGWSVPGVFLSAGGMVLLATGWAARLEGVRDIE